MNEIPETPEWGSFALVSYIPDPLGSALHGLWKALSGEGNARPHITILPPRPLKLPVDAASKRARRILRQFPSFDVELSEVSCFSGTNFLYLDVGEGNSVLYDLHQALNTGTLDYAEKLEFRPHLTLGGPIASGELEAVQKQAETAWQSIVCARRFRLDEVACLWFGPGSQRGEWRKLWSYGLRPSPNAITLARAAVTGQRY